MVSKAIGSAHQPGVLVHLLSAPEGSPFWAAGIRQEIQTCLKSRDFDRQYVGHCVGLLLRSGGWRHLLGERGIPFRSFIQFCYAPKPHGLGLSQRDLQSLPID